MGKVYLVGAGPGAPDLLTLRAARLLERADIVFHDALVHPGTLALAAHARFVDVGKRYGKISTEQRFINRSLIEAARIHATVVRLKGGDPMVFGRAQEELDALAQAGIECEVVPGVTAALAAAATLGVSLTRRGVARTVAILTPRVGKGESASEWLPAALGADSVVL
jgi:uroporphyrin-III C-methyltransferase